MRPVASCDGVYNRSSLDNVTFVLVASLLLPIYGFTRNPYVLPGLGPSVALFGTGHFSGFGAAFLLAVAWLWIPETRGTELI